MKTLPALVLIGIFSATPFTYSQAALVLPPPVASLAELSSLGPNYATLKIDWSSNDPIGDYARYELQQSLNDRPYVTVERNDPTTRSETLNGVPGASYRYRVRGITASGEASEWFEGAAVRVSVEYEASENLKLTGTWERRPANAPRNWGAADKYVRVATQSGATAAYSFSGTSVAWVASVGPGKGKADVYVDGTFSKSVDLGAAEPQFAKLVYGASALAPGASHKLEIKTRSGQVEIFGLVRLGD